MGAGKVRHYLFRFSWGTKTSSQHRRLLLPAPLSPPLAPRPTAPSPSVGGLGSCAVSQGGSRGLGMAWVLGLIPNQPADLPCTELVCLDSGGTQEAVGW